MRYPIIVYTLILSLFTLYNTIVNAQNNNSTSDKCNIEIILETNESIKAVSEDLMLKFLRTFGEECRNNAEFSEFSNETLFGVIQNNPETFCNVLENNKDEIEFEYLISELKNPVHDLIDLPLTIKRIADVKTNSSINSELILAINSANWDESKKIEILESPTLLFYHQDSNQFYSIANSDDSEGIYEASNDFEYYANEIINLYKDSSLNVIISDKRFFIINNELIDKSKLQTVYGLILVKNKEYKIEPGIFTDIGMMQLIRDFFYKK